MQVSRSFCRSSWEHSWPGNCPLRAFGSKGTNGHKGMIQSADLVSSDDDYMDARAEISKFKGAAISLRRRGQFYNQIQHSEFPGQRDKEITDAFNKQNGWLSFASRWFGMTACSLTSRCGFCAVI